MNGAAPIMHTNLLESIFAFSPSGKDKLTILM